MATLSILPPLAGSLPHNPPTTEETTASDSHRPSSPCGSIRIHRPAGGITQENVKVCEADTSAGSTSPETAAAVAAAAQHNDPAHAPLKYVSTASTYKNSLDNSIIRRVPSNSEDSVFRNQKLEDTKPVWAASGRGITGPRAAGLDGFGIIDFSGDALANAIENVKASTPASEPKAMQHPKRPFRKWVQTFNRRRTERQRANQLDLGELELAAALPRPRTIGGSSYRERSSSMSSFAYVTGVREASVSVLGTASIVPSSRKQAARSSKGLSRTDRSSRFSISARQSDDDTANEKQQQQLQAEAHIVARSVKRRRILEELIETEEGYIGDIKFLMNAYMTIFASSPSADARLRLSMYSNLTDIVELHDQILGELHRAIPDSEYSYLSFPRSLYTPPVTQKRRSKNSGAVSEDKSQRQQSKEGTEMTAAPETAAKAAGVFLKKMDRFYIYEEYRAKLDMVLDDLKVTYRSIPNWGDHQKGLEALASCLSYARDWQDSKRALSIDDLLAKPIQRACRYPLLFRELLKATPVCDCPRSHSDIEHVLERLHEVTIAMNKATQDPFFKAHLEKTWILQERLRFPAQAKDGASKSQIRLFGRIDLCGVLHVCWQTSTTVQGSYMICILFHSWLCLAVADTTGKSYELQACLPLKKCSLEQADNGRGMQCHSAPFSWKVAFESNCQLYEVLMTASTAKEEEEWRRRIHDGAVRDSDTQHSPPAFTFVGLDLKALGSAPKTSGKPLQKHAIRRATTVPPKVQMVQVILKNTSSEKEDAQPLERQVGLGRSHSVPRAACIAVTSPSRGDRARLEAVISDVLTRDALMSSSGPRERLLRPSASAMMRRINVLSRTGTFGRRSPPQSPPARAAGEPTPKRPAAPRRHSSDRKMRLGLGHGRLRHHERGDKDERMGAAIQEETAKAGKAEAAQRTDKTQSSSSSGDEDGKAYSLAGGTSDAPAQLPHLAYSFSQRESHETKLATIPRCRPEIQLIEELDESYRLGPAPAKAASHPVMLAPLETSSQSCPAVAATPRCGGGAASDSLTSLTDKLLAASSAYEMMAPLSRIGCREGGEIREGRDSRGSDDGRDGTEAKAPRRWLKRPSLHRASLHRTLKKIQH